MCGISAIFGTNWRTCQLLRMHEAQQHRGTDDEGFYFDPQKICGLAHNRLSIIDLSAHGRQPLTNLNGNLQLIFNGEIYNYRELRRELESEYNFQTLTDTEVLLAALEKWGAAALDRLIGMFAIIFWDERTQSGFAARDRFGVKPLFYHQRQDGALFLASEIKALQAAGFGNQPNEKTWARFLAAGDAEHPSETFWKDIFKLPAGHFLTWRNGRTNIKKWYDLGEKSGVDYDERTDDVVADEYLTLLKDAVRLRFRADVPVGINLSGGVDSATLLGLVHALEKNESAVAAYTFTTGDARYDELPWVRRMLQETRHRHVVCELSAEEVPALAAEVQRFEDEPYGGIPTLAYAKIFEQARRDGTIVLLDGNGLDEQWAGYNYYAETTLAEKFVQGSADKATRPECLTPEFLTLADKLQPGEKVFPDRLRNLQYRDATRSKLPRALRYNDRISMRASTELREPFLDHRLFELALRQPPARKISGGTHKKMLREIIRKFLPVEIVGAPKRALQTPQREWLRGELRDWAQAQIEGALKGPAGVWFDPKAVRREWQNFCAGKSDNSFYVWQWISLNLVNFQHTEAKKGGKNIANRKSNLRSQSRQTL